MENVQSNYDVIINGGGPAGLTAGIYSSRYGLKCLLIERGATGGQMTNAARIENYPGFPDGISGFELGSLMHQQASKYGLEILTAEVTEMDTKPPFTIITNNSRFQTTSVIIAVGSQYRKLSIPGEERLAGHGVSYCATCDGFFFRNQDVAVIGGGDTALTDALELSQFVNKVYIIHRRKELRASHVLQQRAFAQPKIEFIWDSVVEEVLGDTTLNEIRLLNTKTGQHSTVDVKGLFVAVGITPNNGYFQNSIKLDDSGCIVTDSMMATSVPGIFAAGDIRSQSPRQVGAAVGDGVTAAMSAFQYIQENSYETGTRSN